MGEGRKRLPNLAELALSSVRLCASESLEEVKQLQSLTSLHFKYACLPDACFSTIGTMTNLKSLSLKGIRISESPESSAEIDQTLEIQFGVSAVRSIGDFPLQDRHVKALMPLNNLTMLDLSATGADDGEVRNLEELTNLISLHLGGTNVTDTMMYELSALKRLKNLFLGSAKRVFGGTYDTLCWLKNFSGLQILDLNHTRASSAVIDSLTHLNDLRHLNIGGTKFDTESISRMLSLMPLTYVNLAGLALSEDALKNIQDKYKGLGIGTDAERSSLFDPNDYSEITFSLEHGTGSCTMSCIDSIIDSLMDDTDERKGQL